jgi:hypothetical protein
MLISHFPQKNNVTMSLKRKVECLSSGKEEPLQPKCLKTYAPPPRSALARFLEPLPPRRLLTARTLYETTTMPIELIDLVVKYDGAAISLVEEGKGCSVSSSMQLPQFNDITLQGSFAICVSSSDRAMREYSIYHLPECSHCGTFEFAENDTVQNAFWIPTSPIGPYLIHSAYNWSSAVSSDTTLALSAHPSEYRSSRGYYCDNEGDSAWTITNGDLITRSLLTGQETNWGICPITREGYVYIFPSGICLRAKHDYGNGPQSLFYIDRLTRNRKSATTEMWVQKVTERWIVLREDFYASNKLQIMETASLQTIATITLGCSCGPSWMLGKDHLLFRSGYDKTLFVVDLPSGHLEGPLQVDIDINRRILDVSITGFVLIDAYQYGNRLLKLFDVSE